VVFGAVGAPGASGAQTPGEPVFAHPLPAGSTIAVGDVIDLSGSGCPSEGPIGLPDTIHGALLVMVDDAADGRVFPYFVNGSLGGTFAGMAPESRSLLGPAVDSSGVWSASATVDGSWGGGNGELMVTAVCWTLLELDESGESLDPASIERALFEFGPIRYADQSTSTTTTPPSSSTTAASPSTTVPAVAAQPVVAPPRYTG
jgi:hypothetical protein